jgi:hypothetical protein
MIQRLGASLWVRGGSAIKIITIDREPGWKLWDELLTSEVARTTGCDRLALEAREERRDSPHYRLFRGSLRGSFEGTLNAQWAKMRGGWTRQ